MIFIFLIFLALCAFPLLSISSPTPAPVAKVPYLPPPTPDTNGPSDDWFPSNGCCRCVLRARYWNHFRVQQDIANYLCDGRFTRLGPYNCSVIEPGGYAFYPDNNGAHISFLVNLYYQLNKDSEGACEFKGSKVIGVQSEPLWSVFSLQDYRPAARLICGYYKCDFHQNIPLKTKEKVIEKVRVETVFAIRFR